MSSEKRVNPHRSKGGKIAWKRHHSSYMRGVRKREREKMNKTFYDITQELKEALGLTEAKITKDDIFDYTFEVSLSNMSGGISFNINKETGDVSFTTLLVESGKGNYRLENNTNTEDDYKNLYNNIKDDFATLATTIDDSIKQILLKYGLKET